MVIKASVYGAERGPVPDCLAGTEPGTASHAASTFEGVYAATQTTVRDLAFRTMLASNT